jgi:hypothetical protein
VEYNSNTKDVMARLALIRATIASGAFSDSLAAGLNAGMGIMKRRIFNQSLDANGESLGPYYSDTYERERVRRGRQVAKKDLEMEGSLRRSIEVVTVNNLRAEIRIVNDDTANIARYQEQQIYNLRNGHAGNDATGGRVPIFELSEQEVQIVNSTTKALLAQKFNF